MTESTTAPYIDRKPGDLITADDWVRLQGLIQGDIAKQVGDAIAALTNVATSDDATKVGGLTPDDLSKQILDYVERQLPKRTGYLSVFRKLEVGKESVIDHKLGTWPLITIFQLDYFRIVAAEDDHVFDALATFFLHHKSESKIRFRPENDPSGSLQSVDIDPPGGHPYHIPWKHMLELYGVDTPEDATLDEVESEFWQKFNAAPNDVFDDDQYYHSPWFDRCCGERRTVKQLARDWDDIYFQMRPRLTVNYVRTQGNDILPLPAPTMVEAVQYDLESAGVILLDNPVVPQQDPFPWPTDHLKVMVLLKV
jgi:hypothetical protein